MKAPMKTVVVGASSGLGRCIGVGLAERGAHLALLARRHDRLVDAAKEAGPGTLAIAWSSLRPALICGQTLYARATCCSSPAR